MELEDLLKDLGTTLEDVKATTDVKVEKEEIKPEVKEEPVEETMKSKILKRLARYDDLVKAEAKSASDYDILYEELLNSNPELAEKLRQLDMTRDACNSEMEIIKKELLPMFQVAVAEDPENKTLLCNKIQATYVYPTKKHSFDLKDFMEKESSFYFDNISKFTPYAKISDVSDSVKITIKK